MCIILIWELSAVLKVSRFLLTIAKYWIRMEFLHNLTDVTRPPMVSHRNRAPTFEILLSSNGVDVHLNTSIYLYLFLSTYLSLFIINFLYLSWSFNIHIYLFYQSLYISIFFYISLSICLSLSSSIYVYLSLSISIFLCLSLSAILIFQYLSLLSITIY